MAHNTRAAGLYYTACGFLLYFVAAAVSFNGYYDKWHFNENGVAGEDHRFQFEMMVDGTASVSYTHLDVYKRQDCLLSGNSGHPNMDP